MNVTEEELKQRYRQLSGDVLLELWDRNTLTDDARIVLRSELLHRGIEPPEQAVHEECAEVVPMQTDPWVTLAQFSTAPEAHILRARLESHEIPAIVADEHLVTMDWLISNAIGGVRVRVPRTYLEQASCIVAELESGKYTLASEDEIKKCPRCRANNVKENRRSWKVSFLALFLFNFPLPFRSNAYKCLQCGHTWNEAASN